MSSKSYSHFFSKNIRIYAIFNDQSFNGTLTNDIISFEQLGPDSLRLSMPITKTSLYNFDPLKPHFYIVKLGFTGVYNIFLISAQKHRLSLLGEAVLTSTTIYVLSRNMKNIRVFYLKSFLVFGGKFFYIFE